MEDIRRTILDHAVELVAEHGVRGVSFREVARRAGVSHQAPYHHFGNLQGILQAIAKEGFTNLSQAMKKAARHADPIEALNGMGIAYVKFATNNVGHFRVMFRRPPTDGPLEPLEESQATYQTLVDCTSRVIAAGYGEFLDPEGFAHLAWSVVHGLAGLMVEGNLERKTKREMNAETRLVVQSLSSLLIRSKPKLGYRPPGGDSAGSA
ncbi:MAG: TetR/AcrR family transcriptional regulator [Myxococcota bacterium]